MKINCVIKNTKILDQLEILVTDISNSFILKDKLPTPSNIFNEIRNLGVEIDLTTIGAIYAKNLSGTDKTYMTVKEVQTEIGADLHNAVKKMIQLDKGTKEIGKRSQAEAVANAFSNIFVDRNAPPQAKTLMRLMQDTMLKGLKRHLEPDSPLRNSVSPLDIAREALKKMETLGVTDIKGQINNLEDVFNDVKIELDKQIAELKKQNASPETIEKYKDLIEGVKNSTYQLLLSRTEAKDVITEAIKKFKNGIFTKTDSKGKVKLDYDSLSGHVKSEQELRDNVEAALKDQGFTDTEIAIISDSLAQEFKDAYANILEKAINKLNAKQNAKDRATVSKSDIERLAQLHALGAFGSAHEKMIYELLGLSEDSSLDIAQVQDIADELNRMVDAGFIEGNDRARELNQKIDNMISAARYRDAGWLYRRVKNLSDLFSMANLAILNNIKNRTENFASGKMENLNAYISRGSKGLPSEINRLASATKKDIVSNGGLSFGEMNMLFQGDSSATERVREKLAGWVSGGNENGEKITNWFYNQIMGTAALNGIDSANKIKQTWSRFLGAMENNLVENGVVKNKDEAQKKLHEQLFGANWKKAEQKAKDLTDTITRDGSVLKKASPEMIQRLASDIVKAELVNNKLISQEELDATWNASYKAAGRAMGHVANNQFSLALQALNNKSQMAIKTQLDKGNYNYAAGLLFADLFVNKMVLKFAGGGSNWVVLNVEKSGIGLLLGAAKKMVIGKQKTLSQMTTKDIEEELYRHMVQNDKVVRGTVGLAINAGLFLLAYTAFGGDDDDDRKRRKKLLEWAEKNRWANKYLNILPLYITGYLATMQQKDTRDGIQGTFNNYKYSPLKNWVDNFTNRSDTYSFDNQMGKAMGGIFTTTKDAGKAEYNKEKGWQTAGQMLGSYFNVNPLPYRPIKDMKDIVEGVFGRDTKSDRDIKSRKNNYRDGKVDVLPEMIKGYAKYGMFDW